jgi:hypothetical protein
LDLSPSKVIEGIKLWHRLLTSGSEKNMVELDLDWIVYLEEALQQSMNSHKDRIQSLNPQDPFISRIESSPSCSSTFNEDHEKYLLSFHLCFSYLFEKLMYDLRSSSKRPSLDILSEAYARLWRSTLLPNITLLLNFRPICFQIISFSLGLLLCQDDSKSKFSQELRLDVLCGLQQIFNLDLKYRFIHKRYAALEDFSKSRTLNLLSTDISRMQIAINPKITFPANMHFLPANQYTQMNFQCDST